MFKCYNLVKKDLLLFYPILKDKLKYFIFIPKWSLVQKYTYN